jgi:hypothetical protein
MWLYSSGLAQEVQGDMQARLSAVRSTESVVVSS